MLYQFLNYFFVPSTDVKTFLITSIPLPFLTIISKTALTSMKGI